LKKTTVTATTAIFVGAHDIAAGKVGTLRNPANRKKYENAYRLDLKRYDGELTLEKANKRLLVMAKGIRDLPKIRERFGVRGPRSKEAILTLNRILLLPEDVKGDWEVDGPIELGGIAEVLYAERLPTIRLWVHFKEYVIGVVPDGIGEDYVYEFKATTQTGKDALNVRDQAVRQAQLYAYAFKRPNIKIQIAHFKLARGAFPITVKDLPRPDIATLSSPSSEDEALAILHDFDTAFQPSEKEN